MKLFVIKNTLHAFFSRGVLAGIVLSAFAYWRGESNILEGFLTITFLFGLVFALPYLFSVLKAQKYFSNVDLLKMKDVDTEVFISNESFNRFSMRLQSSQHFKHHLIISEGRKILIYEPYRFFHHSHFTIVELIDNKIEVNYRYRITHNQHPNFLPFLLKNQAQTNYSFIKAKAVN